MVPFLGGQHSACLGRMEHGCDESAMNAKQLFGFFTGVRGIDILRSRTSDYTISANFAVTEFSEVRLQLAKNLERRSIKGVRPLKIHRKFIGYWYSCWSARATVSAAGRANPPRWGPKPKSLSIKAAESLNGGWLWRELGVEKGVRQQVQDSCKSVFKAVERSRL